MNHRERDIKFVILIELSMAISAMSFAVRVGGAKCELCQQSNLNKWADHINTSTAWFGEST
jgi:hypothetical protein